MIKILPIACYKLLIGCLVSIPVWSQAQSLEALILYALATHPSTQSQRAQVASAMAGVESARWQFDPTPSVALENAAIRSSDPLYQGDKRVTTLPYGTACSTTTLQARPTPVVNAEGQCGTTETCRYATLNGVHLTVNREWPYRRWFPNANWHKPHLPWADHKWYDLH